MKDSYTIARDIAASSRYLKKNIVAEKGFSPRYIFYRIARPILKVTYKVFKWMNPATPWTSQAAVRIFKQLLRPDMVGLEYGSGNSTIFFAKHLRHLVSVEHDKAWFSNVTASLKQQKLNNVQYQLIPPGVAKPPPYSFYKEYGLAENEFSSRTEFTDYFSAARSFPNESFDMIMIDGRARIECALNAIPKLKSGGIFVLDNSDRRRYRTIFKVLSKWKVITTTTGLFDTTFWFKP